MTEVVESHGLTTSWPAEALAGLLGVPLPDLGSGEGLPLLWHWLYLLDRPPQAALGPDGHRITGGVPSPPGPGKRRMFAGGRVRSLGPFRVGESATRRSTVRSSVDKQGRGGRLTFVTVTHEISQAGRVVVFEEQDIVYRDAVAPVAAAEPAADTEPIGATEAGDAHESGSQSSHDWAITVDPVLLFRFSALTYNGHRIHYDRDYAMGVEGYPGLVVHGPLQAIAMTEAARRSGRLSRETTGQGFCYRLVSPLFDHQGMIVSADHDGADTRTTVRDARGRTTAAGTLTLG